MPRRSTLRQQAATGDGETCPIADDSSNLAGGGAASVSGEQLECERCGAKDHSGEQCPHFSHRRDQTGDGAQPSAAEIAKNIADGIMPTVVIKAELVVMSGAGLDCFYNFFVAALAKLGLDGLWPVVYLCNLMQGYCCWMPSAFSPATTFWRARLYRRGSRDGLTRQACSVMVVCTSIPPLETSTSH